MTAPAPAAPASTTATTGRYLSLDVLRGVAILGTLATNIWILTDPEGMLGYLDQSAAAATPPVWAGVEAVLQQLAMGKFLGLLTIMFGIGLEIQRRSALRRGNAWPGSYPWRAALLFLDGTLHYLLVSEFDVLMGYAVTGLVVAYVLASSARVQRAWFVAAVSVHLVLLGLVVWALAAFPQSPRTEPLPVNPYADGSWWDLVIFRATNPGFRAEAIFILPMGIALFVLGAWLVRRGVLEPRGADLRRRLLILGAVAFAFDLTIGLLGGTAGLIFTRYGTAPLVALGLLAAIAEWIERRPGTTALRRRLAEVGRMALSCYIGQNVVASALCYGWGLGLASAVDPAWRVPFTLAMYVVVSAVILAFAHLWLRRFERGPVEWAWQRAYEAIVRRRPGSQPGSAARD